MNYTPLQRRRVHPSAILMIETKWRRNPKGELISWDHERGKPSVMCGQAYSQGLIEGRQCSNMRGEIELSKLEVNLRVIHFVQRNVQPGHPMTPSFETPRYGALSTECIHVPETHFSGWQDESLGCSLWIGIVRDVILL